MYFYNRVFKVCGEKIKQKKEVRCWGWLVQKIYLDHDVQGLFCSILHRLNETLAAVALDTGHKPLGIHLSTNIVLASGNHRLINFHNLALASKTFRVLQKVPKTIEDCMKAGLMKTYHKQTSRNRSFHSTIVSVPSVVPFSRRNSNCRSSCRLIRRHQR
jgi:hypothetical protein